MRQPLTELRTPLLAASSLRARTPPLLGHRPQPVPSAPPPPKPSRRYKPRGTGGQPDAPSISGPHIPRNPALRRVRKLTSGPLAEARQGQTITSRGSHSGEAAERSSQAQIGTHEGRQDLASEAAKSFRRDYVLAPRGLPSTEPRSGAVTGSPRRVSPRDALLAPRLDARARHIKCPPAEKHLSRLTFRPHLPPPPLPRAVLGSAATSADAQHS